MDHAISLAYKGKPSPNPKVGAVLARQDRIVGSGFHRRSGFPHAEVIAIRDAGRRAQGATLYTNLEPCCHYGQTPPCTDQIIKSGIEKVVVGMVDPNPVVSCRGIEQLKRAGIEVKVGIEEGKCQQLNRGYIKRIKTGLPYTILKIGSSLDGRIATTTGVSRWITSKTARIFSHALRLQVDAVLVGIGTVLRDDPQLTVRHILGDNPARIIVDTDLKTPAQASVLNNDGQPYILSKRKNSVLDARIIELQDFSPAAILQKVGELGFNEILVEGGGRIFSSMIESALFDEIIIMYGAKILGEGVSFAQFKIDKLAESLKIDIVEVKRFGPDLMIRGLNVHRDNN